MNDYDSTYIRPLRFQNRVASIVKAKNLGLRSKTAGTVSERRLTYALVVLEYVYLYKYV